MDFLLVGAAAASRHVVSAPVLSGSASLSGVSSVVVSVLANRKGSASISVTTAIVALSMNALDLEDIAEVLELEDIAEALELE